MQSKKNLDKNLQELKKISKILFEQQKDTPCHLASQKDIKEIIQELLKLFFPMHYKKVSYKNAEETEKDILTLYQKLKETISPFVQQCPAKNKKDVDAILSKFILELPVIYEKLQKDIEAGYMGDPAAQSTNEIILAYPGFYAIFVYRIAHIFYQCQVPVFPRMLSEYAHSKTGIDIHPGAKIQDSFFIDHGTGVVIGETCEIGNYVKIYQGVTLGALSVDKKLAKTKRHPTIEDNVIIYAGATILGGDTVIGHDSIVGGNVWVTRSLSPSSTIHYKSESKIRTTRKKYDL